MIKCLRNAAGDEIEIVQTRFSHPEQTTGQHTNGPATIFWREYPDGEWWAFDSKTMYVLGSTFLEDGLEAVKARSGRLSEVTE